jgi:hypothetical protein
LNTKYLNISATWHCKKAGGLFLGFQMHFPARIVPSAENYDFFDESDFCDSILIKLGFLLFTVDLKLKYNHYFRKNAYKE